MKLKEIPLAQIRAGKNVRTEPEQDLGGLMESIEKYDILQPILVVQRDGYYELISGHRRLAAMKARNEATVPAIVRDDVSDRDIPYLRLVENIQRKELSAREVVEALDALKASRPGISVRGLGKAVGKTDAWVYEQYLAARTYEELLASGMTEAELRGLSKTDLTHLGRVQDKKDRLDAARSIGPRSKEALRAARRVTKRGGMIDRTGGFAIMSGAGSLTIRVVCDCQEARREVLASLLRLKTRRVKSGK
jgi:ParB/RepB/Spo0J family partition protein